MSRILVAGIDEIDPAKFKPVSDRENNRMFYMNKPDNCLYGSTYLPDRLYKSGWLEWVALNDFYTDKYRKGISFTLSKKARICNITCLEDYVTIAKKYSVKKYDNNDGFSHPEKVIDFVKLSKDYDCFHITEEAFYRLRLPWNNYEDLLDESDGYYFSDFYSYDCETWIMFNLDCINYGSIINHNNILTEEMEYRYL